MPLALITGTSGFVGGAIAATLRETHEVLSLLRRPPVLGHNYTQWDMYESLPASLPDQIDLVIHAAAIDGRNSDAPARDCFQVNTAATAQLLEYAARAKAKQFLYLSTGSVYPTCEQPLTESIAIAPTGHYAASKAAAECLLAGYSQQMSIVNLRLFHPYGVGQKLPKLIPGLIDKIRRGLPISLQGEAGLPTINPVNMRDLVTWVVKLIQAQAHGTFNVAGTENVTIRELALLLADLTGNKVRFEIGPASAGSRLGEISRIAAATGYSPQVPLRAGLMELLASE